MRIAGVNIFIVLLGDSRMKLKNFPGKLNGKIVKRDAKDVSDYPAHVYCHDMMGKKKIDLQYIILLFIWIAVCLIEGFSSRYGENVLLFAAIINAACFIINAVLGFLFLMGRLEEKLIYLFFFVLCIIVLTESFFTTLWRICVVNYRH